MEVCSKIATETDVTCRLELPTQIKQHIPFLHGQNSVDLRVTDRSGQEWIFSYCRRQVGYAKPCLRTGWLDFVRSKDVQIGDRITIRQLNEGGFRIEVDRTTDVMLFGTHITNLQVA